MKQTEYPRGTRGVAATRPRILTLQNELGPPQVAFVADANLLATAKNASELVFVNATPQVDINAYTPFPSNYFAAAMEVLPPTGDPTHVVIDWVRNHSAANASKDMTFAVYPFVANV